MLGVGWFIQLSCGRNHLKTAVLGVGRMGRRHIEVIQAMDLDLAGIYDRSADALDEISPGAAWNGMELSPDCARGGLALDTGRAGFEEHGKVNKSVAIVAILRNLETLWWQFLILNPKLPTSEILTQLASKKSLLHGFHIIIGADQVTHVKYILWKV